MEGEEAEHSTLFLFSSDHFGGEACNIYCISLGSPISLNIKNIKKMGQLARELGFAVFQGFRG